MKNTIKNIGLDVHKNSISTGIADDGRDDEVRYYGKIDNNMDQLDCMVDTRKNLRICQPQNLTVNTILGFYNIRVLRVLTISGACPRIGILLKIEEFSENKHSHICDIPSIIFSK